MGAIRPIQSHVFRGRRWQVRDCTRLPRGYLGLCEDWRLGARGRTVYVPIDGDTEEELDTTLHEALHACTELNEEAIDETATDCARLLWRLGWRKE